MPISGTDKRVLATFTLAAAGDYAAAMTLIEALLEQDLDWRDENNLRMFNNYLICCLKEQEHEKGSALADRLQEVAPGNPHIYHNAACLYCFCGQLERAMEQVRLGHRHGGEALMKLLDDDDELAPIAHRREFLELVGSGTPPPDEPAPFALLTLTRQGRDTSTVRRDA
jgi:tetratricopeptide (TPR) repeat protein